MGTLDSALAWLASLPQGALVGAMALLAAAENVFPPIPADVMVAFGAFVAARGGHSALPAFIAVWLGNMAGVAAMYRLGQRYGTSQIERRFHLNVTGQAGRLSALHGKYGTFALFLSRFVPGLRAVVPPVAGALRLPFVPAMLAMAAASGLWYGAVTMLAFRAGSNWETLRAALGGLGSWSAGVALGLVLIAGGALWWRSRRDRSRPA